MNLPGVRNSSVYFLFLALILISACTGQPEAKRDVTGVEIVEFRPDVEEVAAGNDAIIRLRAQNVGDADATSVTAIVYKCGNLLANSAKCPVTYPSLGDLPGADLSSNLPGSETQKIFTFSTTDVKAAENERIEQEIGLRLAYTYESSATAEIPVLSNARYKELEREGTLPVSKTDSTLAPIRVSIIAPQQAVGNAYVNLDIELEKLLDGYVEDSGCTNKVGCINSIKIAISGKGLAKQDCNDRGGTELWRTGKRTITCTLRPDCSEGECYPTIKVTAKYTYVTETTTTLTIKGTPGSGAGGPLPPPPPEGQTSSFDVISLSPAKGPVTQEITVTGTNFSKTEKNINLYIEGETYWMENVNGEGLKRQRDKGWVLLKLTPTPPTTSGSDGFGVNPTVVGNHSEFTAKFNIPHALASNVISQVFAVGASRENSTITDTEGYGNRVNLEIEPKAKITVTPQDATSGQGTTVNIRGEKYPASTPVTISFLNPLCAYYSGAPAITPNCAKHVTQKTTDASGTFSYLFLLDQAFLDTNKISSGYYLVFANASSTDDKTALNGAGEFTISFGGADDDKDYVPNDLDKCPTPPGVPVCSVYEATQTGECYQKAGCEKMPVSYVSGSLVALKIVSKETGPYTILYDDNKPNDFIVKKNGVEAKLETQDINNIPRGSDILLVFNVQNTISEDITDSMEVYVRGIVLNTDLQTEPAHCKGITLNAKTTETCALLWTNSWAKKYVTELKITKSGNDYIKSGFEFTVS